MKKLSLTGNQLKLIAAVTMTLDHIGAYLFPSVLWLRIVGRLAFPIFAYMVGEGGRYTHRPARYLLTVSGVALLCQLTELFVRDSLQQCIMVTFTMSVGLILLLRRAGEKKTPTSRLAALAGLIGALLICELLPRLVSGFRIDYGLLGVLAPVAVYLAKDRLQALFGLGLCLAGIAGSSMWIQWLSLGALPLLALYSGQRGSAKLKYFFYLYYPLHLAAIYLLGMFL